MLPERRIHPRYYLHFPVTVEMALPGEKKRLTLESVTISRNGLELSGDGEMMGAFLSQHRYPQTCQVRFRLPGGDHEYHMDCQLVTHRRLSQHHFQAVLLFTDYHDHCEGLLADELRDMQPLNLNQSVSAGMLRKAGNL